ncbi:MAG: peptide ABC transporter substrate-binding protein [Candidatus Dormibacteria bacterium]
MGLYAAPESFNPLVAGDLNSVRAYTPLFPHLYSVSPDLTITPDLATSLPAVDGTTWTVTLRSTARWSDGKPITATDVVYTITTEKNPALDTQATFDWSEVTSVVAVDPHTVRLTLTRPDASFLGDHLTTAIVPAHVLGDTAVAQMSQSLFGQKPLVSGGPFRFVAKVSGSEWQLDANPTYYGARPRLDTIDEVVVADPALLSGQLAAGSVLYDNGLTAAQAADARSQYGVNVSSYAALGYYAVQPNERAGRLFADVALRRALDDTLDRRAITARATGGTGTVMWSDISPESWVYRSAGITPHPADVAAARALLAADGWTAPGGGTASKGGTPLSATLIYPRSDPARALAAQVVVAEARAAGFSLTAQAVEDGTYGDDLAAGTFDLALTAGGLGVDPDDSPTLACDAIPPANPAGLNAGGFCDPALDALFTQEQAATGTSWSALSSARAPIFAQIEARVAQEVPLIPLWTDTRWVAVNITVGGVTVGPQLDEDLGSAYLASWYLTSS